MSPIRLVILPVLCLPLLFPPGAFAQKKKQSKGESAAIAGPSNFVARPAEFSVTREAINPGLEPFTVTVGSFGNTLNRNGRDGFEPVTFRTKIMVGEDSPDRIVPRSRAQLDSHNSWASGYLDGATVRVYRIIDGKLQLVRRDSVPAGGTVIASWNYNTGEVIKPGVNEGYWSWASWSRPGTTDWFTVFAVDKAGNVAAGKPVSLKRPDGELRGDARQRNETAGFKANAKLDDKVAPPAPANVRAELTPEKFVKLTWDAVDAPDLAGYFIAQSDVDPAEHKGVYLQLASAPKDPKEHLKAGDMVIVDHEFRTLDRKRFSNRVANLWKATGEFAPDHVPNEFYPGEVPGKTWTLRDHAADTPVTEPGRTYLEMTLREGDVEKIGKSGTPDIGTVRQDYYPVPKAAEYRMEVWMKADRADAPAVTFEFDGDSEVGGFLQPFSLQPGTEWKKFEYTFNARPSDKGHYAYLVLTCKGPATYSIDNFRIYRTDSPYLGFTPEEIAKFKASGMAAIRTHGPIKTGEATYSMAAFTNPGGVIQGVSRGNTLPQQLAAIRQAGAHPWLQIEFHMSAEEWLGFVEYIAAPYDPAKDTPSAKPWAAKRHAQGRTEPWTDAFERIYFELSNETWNGLFAPWTFEPMTDASTGVEYTRGEVYGMMQDYVAGIFRSSPYWSPALEEKFIHVMGGWANGTYSAEAVKGSTTGEFITIAAYNGGWDEGEGPPKPGPASFFNVLSQANATAVHRARQNAQLKVDAEKAGRTLRLGTYEAGPGYALNGLNNAQVTREQAAAQEQVMKSKLAGTATLDSFLTYASWGYALQNFFTFEEGDLWKSHAKWYRGGQPHACFLPLQLFNTEAAGDMLHTVTRSVSTVDLPQSRRRNALANAPLAAAYATRKADRVALICVNRAYPGYPEAGHDGYTPFAVELPFTRAGKITLHRLTGAPEDTNIDAERVKIETVAIPADALVGGKLTITEKTGGHARGLPPGEVFLYVFEGTDLAGESPPLPLDKRLGEPVGFTPAP